LRIPEIDPHFSRINTELSHAVAQGASFHTQSGGRSFRTTHESFGVEIRVKALLRWLKQEGLPEALLQTISSVSSTSAASA
jgi:hypothetical protein